MRLLTVSLLLWAPIIASAQRSGAAPAKPSAAAARVMDACQLVTPAELATVIGFAFKPGVEVSKPPNGQCGFDPVTGSDGGVGITLYDSNVTATFDTFAKFGGTESLTGIGDKAFVNSRMRHLFIMKGNRAVNLKFNYGTALSRAHAEAVAKIVAGRL